MPKKPLSVEIAIPAYNEEDCLRENVLILHEWLKESANFTWLITIADNASTDRTREIGEELSSNYERIRYIRLPVKGRGYALKHVFLQSEAEVVGYMDVDLSTSINYLNVLIEGIACGIDLAIGSRLKQASRIERSLYREVTSRTLNIISKCLFFARYSDSQCGFKALRADVARELVPLVENNHWFFDAELLLIAEYNKYRIFEVPVDWKEGIRSRTKVQVPKTVLEMLGGLLRLRFSIHKKKVKRDSDRKGRNEDLGA